MPDLPGGTVTFLFTDIEGSTKLWQQFPDAMPDALARHNEILQDAIDSHNGYVFQIIGDAFCAAFATAADGLDAALAAQRALHEKAWGKTGPLYVRMALHTGGAEVRAGEFTSGEYVSGITLSRTARLLSAGYGGQILLSAPTAELVRGQLPPHTALRDLGSHRLKDLLQPQEIFQVLTDDLPRDFPPLKAFDVLPNNLPIQLTSFVGRTRELNELKELIGRTRLLTLTGAGGSGKTRLSLQVAAEVIDTFEKGAWFAELDSISDPSFVPNAVMNALQLREDAGRAPLDALTDFLRAKELLLIMDNCEQVIQACADLTHHLLTHCPNLKILATSREGLGAAGEVTYQVPVLGLPEPEHLPPLETLLQYDAVKLFVERTRSVQQSFAVTNANAPAVAQICASLDGIPLAIELAAARVKGLSVEQIASRLDDRFRLLTGGSRTALPRQRTLQAAIDWSYKLLSEEERVLLQRLSVFAGGWTVEAAEYVCEGDGLKSNQILDLLLHLIDKSLVEAETENTEPRYRLLETIRQYAGDKLRESGEVKLIHDRHLGYFVKYAEQAEAGLSGPGQRDWASRLETEHNNLRAALSWSLESNQIKAGLQMAGALQRFWHTQGHLSEGSRWLEKLLTAGDGVGGTERAKALRASSLISGLMGDYPRARTSAESSIDLYREIGDDRGAGLALAALGATYSYEGKREEAIESLQESLNLLEPRGEWSGIVYAHLWLGDVWLRLGDTTRAATNWEESLRLAQELGDNYLMAWSLGGLADVARLRGDYERAIRMHREILSLYRDLGNKSEAPWTLEALGLIAAALGESRRAARLWGAASAWREAVNAPLPPSIQSDYAESIARARTQLGERDYASAWSEGRALSMDEAIELALRGD